jgi:hypothetical protein
VQQAEIGALLRLVNQVESGGVAPNDVPMNLSAAFLKGVNNRTYVPFSVSLDLGPVASTSLTGYLRVVKRGADKELPPAEKPPKANMVWVNVGAAIYHRTGDPAYGRGKASKFMTQEEAQAGGAREAKPDEKVFIPDPVFEDLYSLEIKSITAGQKPHFERAFLLPAGDYDVFLAVKERADEKGVAKATVLRQALTIPDLWTAELATSTIFMTNKVAELQAPLTDQQQASRPFTIGLLQFVPLFDARFSKKDNLDIVFLVYNTGLDGTQKPDLAVDYAFYQKPADGPEKYFNKTDTLVFNAQTLPKDFDAAKHLILVPQEMLASIFAEGTWRLEIKITDKIQKKVLTKNVVFTIAG